MKGKLIIATQFPLVVLVIWTCMCWFMLGLFYFDEVLQDIFEMLIVAEGAKAVLLWLMPITLFLSWLCFWATVAFKALGVIFDLGRRLNGKSKRA